MSSKFKLTIVLDTIDDLAAFVAGLRHSVGKDVLDQVLAQAESPASSFNAVDEKGLIHSKGQEPVSATASADTPITRRRKAAKAKPAAEVSLSSAPTSEAGPEDTPVVSQQAPTNTTYLLTDVREHLQHLAALKGMEAAMALLSTYAAQRISDLPVEKYGEFINACVVAEKAAA